MICRKLSDAVGLEISKSGKHYKGDLLALIKPFPNLQQGLMPQARMDFDIQQHIRNFRIERMQIRDGKDHVFDRMDRYVLHPNGAMPVGVLLLEGHPGRLKQALRVI